VAPFDITTVSVRFGHINVRPAHDSSRERRLTVANDAPNVKGTGKSAKKPYEKPQLEVYGDIREIAKSAALMGMMDNALGVLRSQ
jgi:hypothetical protein